MLSMVFKPKTAERLQLKEGDIVVKLSGYRKGFIAENELEKELGELTGEDKQLPLDIIVFWHMTHFNLSPREPYVRVLKPIAEQPVAHEIQLKAATEPVDATPWALGHHNGPEGKDARAPLTLPM